MGPVDLSTAEIEEAMRDPRVRRAFRDEMWYTGDLSWCLRKHGQTWIYDWIHEEYEKNPGPAPFVVETHRRLGKSFLGLDFIEEQLIKNPGWRAVYATPTKEEALGIVPPNQARLNRSCPKPLKPKTSKWQSVFRNPRWGLDAQPSTMDIFGVNANPDAARGAYCDLLVVDEAGYIEELIYFMTDVMAFQFNKRPRPLVVMFSTPPPTMDHPFITKYVPEAMAAGRHMVIPASKNPDFTAQDEEIVLQICGSKESIAWKREAECQHISDPERLIVPEWQDVRTSSLCEFAPPAYFYPMVVVDTGWSDHCHVLFMYVDFETQKLCVLDEIWGHYLSEGQLVDAIRLKERQVFPESTTAKLSRLRRIADATLLELNSFFIDHRMQFEPAQRHDADATMAALRTLIGRDKVRVHPRCQQLAYQLDNGIWNEKRTDFVRSDMLGHCDGIKALAYGNKQADWRGNPLPKETRGRDTFYRDDRRIFRKKKQGHPVKDFFDK